MAPLSQTAAAQKGSDKRKISSRETPAEALRQRRDLHHGAQSASPEMTSLTTGRLHPQRTKNISAIGEASRRRKHQNTVAEVETEVAIRTKCRSRNSLKLLS